MASTNPVTPLPVGVVTFLFTDIEGSTRLATELGADWFGVLQEHYRVLGDVFPEFGGVLVKTVGDSFFVVFPAAAQAIAATVEMQRALAAHDWSPHRPIHVRMGLHTGEATQYDHDYAGITVHATAHVESAASGGQVLLTEATLAAAGDALREDVDVIDLGMHRLKDLPAEVHIFQVVAEGLEREFPPIRSLDVLRNNVPVPASTFIGRTEALAALHRQLDDNRLVTLVGPGGAGKTRLSLKLASERLHRYPDGVWFVELDAARDELSVATAVADALGVREEPGRPVLDGVVEYARDRQLLLVIDNCEHVIHAAAEVVHALLRAGAGVRGVATSREPLDIDGERVWPVAPLSLNGGPPESSEAVQLLVERIERVQPDFEITPDAAPALVAIARQLDGLPLALELAAASASLLSLEEIAEQLDNRFELLTRGKRTALDRQKTLWGAIDWSFDLLSEPFRALFRRLAVFPSEFDYEAAVAICGDGVPDATAGVTQLVAKSLLTPTPSRRLRLLESIRSYARERQTQSGEGEVIEERHARWFASALLVPEDGPSWARDPDGLDTVHDDLTASLSWATDHDRPLALQLLEPFHGYWVRRARWAEGRMLGERTLQATADIESDTRAEALIRAADLALNQGDFATARTYFEQAASLTGRLAGEEAEQVVLANLGMIAMRQGDLETAEQLFSRALSFIRARSTPRGLATVLLQLAEVARMRADVDLAWSRGSEALDVARAEGDDSLALHIVNLLGGVAQQRGDLETAQRLYSETLEGARAEGDQSVMIYLLFCLATLALDSGDANQAAPLLAEAITLGRDADAKADLAESLEATARLASEYGEHAVACRLLAAVDELREAIGFPRPPAELGTYEASLDRLRGTCGMTFDNEWSTGAAMSLDDAIAAALAVLGV